MLLCIVKCRYAYVHIYIKLYTFLNFLGHECFHIVFLFTGLTNHKGCSGAVVPCLLLSQPSQQEGLCTWLSCRKLLVEHCWLLDGCPQMALSCSDVCGQLALLFGAVLDEAGSARVMGHPTLSSLHRRLLPGNRVP